MSAGTVVLEVVRWIGYAMKVTEAGASVYDSVKAGQDKDLSTGEKVAIITTNGVFCALQMADVGMDAHSTISNYAKPSVPIEVKIGSRAEGAESSSLCPRVPAVDPNSIDPSGRVIPGSRSGGSMPLPDRAIQDLSIPLENRTQQDIASEILKNRKAAKTYDHVRMAVKGAAGLSEVGRHVVKKVCKARRHGLDVHDYLDLLGVICSRAGECVGLASETYPEIFSGHETKVRIASEILSDCCVIFRNTRRLEEFGKLIKEAIEKARKKNEPSTDDVKNDSDEKAEEENQSTPSTDDLKNDSNFQLGEAMWNEVYKALSTGDISKLEKVPDLFKKDPILQSYSCGVDGEPIRFVMMVQAELKDGPIYYEKECLQKWFIEKPSEKPPRWPEKLKEWSWSDVEEFNKDNYPVSIAQKKIDKRLNLLVSEFRSYRIKIEG